MKTKILCNFKNSSVENSCSTLTNTAVFLYLVLYALIPSGYAFGPALLLIGTLGSIWHTNFRQNISHDSKKIFIVLSLMPLLSLILMLFHGFDSSLLDRYSKFFFAALCLLFLLKHPPSERIFWLGCILGATALGVYSISQVILWEMKLPPLFYPYNGGRVSGADNPIYFGNSALLLGLFSLAGLNWALKSAKSRAWAVSMVVAFFLGITASALSGTRSGWITVPFAFLVFLRIYKEHLNIKLITALSIIALILASTLLQKTELYSRSLLTIENVKSYFSGENKKTSIGLRLEMWKAGLIAVKESPFIGMGDSGYKSFQDQLINEGKIHPSLKKFRHLHNQYIDTLAKEGIIGLMPLILLFLIPLKIFYRYSNSPDSSIRSLAAAGIILMIANIDISLTQGLFGRNLGVMKFAFMLIFIWSILSKHEHERQMI